MHNDFVSGARELAAATGCQVGASASGGLLYPSLRLQEDDELDLGEFKLRVLHTPGHTPEHISFMVIEQVGGKTSRPPFSPAEPFCWAERPG